MSYERIEALLGQIAVSLAQIAANTAPEAPEAPDLQRPLADYAGFDWNAIGAQIVRNDEFGAALVEYDGKLWTRRSPENKFGEAIWFSRAAGKNPDDTNRYLRLITFRPIHDPEPLSRATEKALSNTLHQTTPPTRPTPIGPSALKGPAALATPTAPTAPVAEAAGWSDVANQTRTSAAPPTTPQPPAAAPKKTRKASIKVPNFGADTKDLLERLAAEGLTVEFVDADGLINYDKVLWFIGGHDIAEITAESLPRCLELIEQHVRKGKHA